MADHDLVIRGGIVVDGTGAPARRPTSRSTTAHHDRRRGRRPRPRGARRRRPARDARAGSTCTRTTTARSRWDTLLTPSSWQGVTTVVMGNCGVGFAPVRPDRHDWLIELMEGVEDIPGTALHEGITWEWETLPRVPRRDRRDSRTRIDIGAQVPARRAARLRDGRPRRRPHRGADRRRDRTHGRARGRGHRRRRARLLHVAHRRAPVADGTSTPSLTATADELLGIAPRHRRDRAGRVRDRLRPRRPRRASSRSMRAMAEVSGRPMSITTLQRPEQRPTSTARILGLIDEAVADGVRCSRPGGGPPVGLVMTPRRPREPVLASPTYQELARCRSPTRSQRLARPRAAGDDPAASSEARRPRPLPLRARVRARRPASLRSADPRTSLDLRRVVYDALLSRRRARRRSTSRS